MSFVPENGPEDSVSFFPADSDLMSMSIKVVVYKGCYDYVWGERSSDDAPEETRYTGPIELKVLWDSYMHEGVLLRGSI